MGSQFSKRTESSNHSSRPPSRSNSNPRTGPDLSSYEDACRLDPDLQSFDSNLHDRTSRVITSLSAGVDVRSLSLDSLQEVTSCLLDMNHEVVDVILECREDIWKNKELADLVKEYFENSLVNLDFCNALEKCLKRARDSQLIVKVALQRFEEEQREFAAAEAEGGGGNGPNFFTKTLQELKEFGAAGDPFTDEFFAIFRSVQKQQMLMLTKLQRRKLKLDKKLRSLKSWRRVSNVMFGATFAIVLICSVVAAAIAAPPVVTALAAAAAIPLGSMGKWFNSLWKKYENEIRGQREIVSSMQIGTYIAIKDLDNIRVLVDRFRIVIESLLQDAEFAGAHEDGVVLAVGEIKKKVSEYMQTIEDLSEHANKFSRDISKARIVILQRIIKHPSSH